MVAPDENPKELGPELYLAIIGIGNQWQEYLRAVGAAELSLRLVLFLDGVQFGCDELPLCLFQARLGGASEL